METFPVFSHLTASIGGFLHAGFDVYVLGLLLAFALFFTFAGLTLLQETLLGFVVGFGIFLILHILLSPQYWTNEPWCFSTGVEQLIVGSSVYMIFLLAFLVPFKLNIHIPEPDHKWIRITHGVLFGAILFAAAFVTIFGLMEERSVFRIENIFHVFMDGHSEMIQPVQASSLFYRVLMPHSQLILVAAVMSVLYIFLLAETMHTVILSFMRSFFTPTKAHFRPATGGGEMMAEGFDEHMLAHEDHGGHDDHHGHH